MKLYLLVMAAASVFGFLKAVAVANIVSIDGFGNYASVLGAAMFLTMALSLGEIEATIKRFPRLWVDEKRGDIQQQSRRIGRSMLIRSVTILAVLSAGALVLGQQNQLPAVTMIVALGFAGILVRLESAQVLAVGNSGLIARFSLARATFAIIAASAGAAMFGWHGAIGGEIVAAAATIIQAKLSLRPFLGAKNRVPNGAVGALNRDTHLYAAALFSSAPAMLDRGIVATTAGLAIAGQYGFAMIIAQVGQVMANIIGQRVGPGIIRQRKREPNNPTAGLAGMFKACGVIVALSIVASAAFLLVSHTGLGAGLAEKYQITSLTTLLAGVLGGTSVLVVIEYAVIAADRERDVLVGSAVALAIFGVGFAAVAAMGGGVDAFVSVACLARLIQVGWLVRSAI